MVGCGSTIAEPTPDIPPIVQAKVLVDPQTAKLAPSPQPTDRTTDSPRQTASTNGDDGGKYQQPKWVSLFTTDPQVLAYRWYTADECPSGDYSYRDDLYLFAPEEVLSAVEMQQRDTGEKIIGVEGFHSTDGYICLALSESIHPSNFTALHELAHAIVYSEHGLTGHNKILDRALIDLALKFDDADCVTDDHRLSAFLFLHAPIFFRPTPTPDHTSPLFRFCYGETSNPSLVFPTPEPTATPVHITPNHRAPPTLEFGVNGAVGKRFNLGNDPEGKWIGGSGLMWSFNVNTVINDQEFVMETSLKNTLSGTSSQIVYWRFAEDGHYLIFARDAYDPDVPLVYIWCVHEGQWLDMGRFWPKDLTPKTSAAGARFLDNFKVYTTGLGYHGIPSAPLSFDFPSDYPAR